MVWLKVDDKLYSHAKVTAIPREQRAEAMGTWTLCGTWAADHRTDGKIPEHVVEEQGGTLAGAASLVAVRLWRKVRGGFQVVNWEQFQPTRSELDERTRVEREKSRARREQGKQKSPDEGGGSIRGSSVGTHGSTTTPVPSRPDPTDSLCSSVPPPGDNPVDGPMDEASSAAQVEDEDARRWGSYRGVDVPRIRKELARCAKRLVDEPTALRVALEVLDRAAGQPDRPTGYVLVAIRNDWAEWQAFIDRGAA